MRTLLKLNGRLKAGLILLLIFIILGLVLPRFSPYNAIDWNVVPRNLPASKIHIFGTTGLGQDTFWLLTFAIQNSLFIGLIVALFSTAIGVLAGLTAGYAGGIVDRVLSLLMDVFISVPSLPILILVASLLQGKTSLLTIGIALIIFNWPWPARQVRAIALSMREREFINTARFSGKGTLGIVVYEIFPYVLNWSVANFVNTVLVAISIESGLAVIGLSSVQQATLGTMIYWALQYQAVLGKRWFWIGAPVVSIVILFIGLFLASTDTPNTPPKNEAVKVLKLRDVKAYYQTPKATIQAVDGVTLDIFENEILGIAGESGCGKSTLLKVLYDSVQPPLKIVSGEMTAEMKDENGQTVLLGPGEIRKHWWRFISYIPQGSMSVLNPVVKIESQFFDAISKKHNLTNKKEMHERIAAYLKELDLPVEVLNSYAHQLSGGMRQRVLVALGTFLHPQIVLADEPTTALDVVIQKSILLMLMDLQQRMKNSLVIVSHDMGVHYQITNRIAIMYAGKIVEVGPTERVFNNPKHPYTQMLIQSLPHVGDRGERKGIGGRPPSLIDPPQGCRYAARCPFVMDRCKEASPELIEVEPNHFAACYLNEMKGA